MIDKLPPKIIIGISGRAGSGKDLVAEYIRQSVDEPIAIFRFADTIKDCTCRILGCSLSDLENRAFKDSPLGGAWGDLTPRYFMQVFGTEFGRKLIGQDIWVNSCMSNLLGNLINIIPDVRFHNEADAIKARGGVLIRVNRGETKDDVHESESALDNYDGFDYIIDNNHTTSDLFKSVQSIIEDLKTLKL